MYPITLLFPHQLFEQHPALAPDREVVLVEEWLFFRQYAFHKRKLRLHRASMQYYKDKLIRQGYRVRYIEALDPASDIRTLLENLHREGVGELHFTELSDNWLDRRLRQKAGALGMQLIESRSPLFINSLDDIHAFFHQKKRFFQTPFYIDQRKKRGVLLDEQGEPLGGKWSYDADNRQRYPKNKIPPPLQWPTLDPWQVEAKGYVQAVFADNPGELTDDIIYPCDHAGSRAWLEDFITARFREFGPYEDAIVAHASWLHHSVLTPMLNIGLLTPQQVLDRVLVRGMQEGIPLNSLEGFVRQVLGWREFIRAVYHLRGSDERTTNFWGFKRKIPRSFYTGTTGIDPVDQVIRKVLRTGYGHHIERLMVLGNFMLLCAFDPDEVYRWFMELFVDAYDWVMVPNVYGMSQFADGGLMATKPYISGSNYLLKMSDFPKGDWQKVWDGLFWRFMHVHRDFFLQNPRLGMLVRTFDKMPAEKKEAHLAEANAFLARLDAEV
jgi:deoxyribodipyrimidine photolyase-related protein